MGYLDARLIDITRAAKCSAGTFYTYFSSKEEIFAAVLEVAQEDMLHPGMRPRTIRRPSSRPATGPTCRHTSATRS